MSLRYDDNPEWDPDNDGTERIDGVVDLALNLTSFIEFRKPETEFKTFNESLFIADTTGYIHRHSTERYEGTLNFNDKRLSKILTERFEEMWGRATPDPNLKRVHI